MKIADLVMVVTALVSGAGCSSVDLLRQNISVQAVSADRQILVMLKEFPVRHYQPASLAISAYNSRTVPAGQLATVENLAQEYDFRILSDWPMPAIGVRCFLGDVGPGRATVDVASRLSTDPRVESAQPVQLFHTLWRNDPFYALQENAQLLHFDQLHRMATGRHVKVALIDTGVDLHQPDLQGQFSDVTNFVDNTKYVAEIHGTAVAGIIAAKADNGVGIVGVAPAATLMPLRACWQLSADAGDALCDSFTLAKAIQYALTHRARVLNLSLAGPRDRLLERLIDKAVEQDITVISAIDPAAPDGSFPASRPDVIAVASTGFPFSRGRIILAPGDHVLTTLPNASWGFVSGSSFATAQVTGIAALLLERSPVLKPGDISSLLHQHERRTGQAGEPSVLDACAMLASVSANRDCHCCGAIANRRTRQQAGTPPS